MNPVEAALRRISTDLERERREWALVGGFAVSARAEPRFTRDVDVAVAVSDDAAAETLVRSLIADGYQLMASIEHETAARLATARLTSAQEDEGEGVVVDVLFASSGIEPEIAAAAEPIEIVPGLTIPVAQAGHLIALKLLARDDDTRPQDLIDLRALLAVATAPDIELARASIALIVRRGFNRDRDLRQALERLLDA